MNNQHKLTAVIESDLNSMAAKFPPVAAVTNQGNFLYVQRIRPGKELIARGYKMNNNEIIIPEVMYKVRELQYVNHKQELTKAFQADGWDGVIKYEAYMNSLKSAGRMQLTEMISGRRWHRKAIIYCRFHLVRHFLNIKKMITK